MGKRSVSVRERPVTSAPRPRGQDVQSSTGRLAKPSAPSSLVCGPERSHSFPNHTQRALQRSCLHPSPGLRATPLPPEEEVREHLGSYSRLPFIGRLCFLFCEMGTLILLTSQTAGGAADDAAQVFPAVSVERLRGPGPCGSPMAPHSERSGVPPSSRQPRIAGKKGGSSFPQI